MGSTALTRDCRMIVTGSWREPGSAKQDGFAVARSPAVNSAHRCVCTPVTLDAPLDRSAEKAGSYEMK